MYGGDVGSAFIALILIGCLIGACGTCTVQYAIKHIDVSVEVK